MPLNEPLTWQQIAELYREIQDGIAKCAAIMQDAVDKGIVRRSGDDYESLDYQGNPICR